MVIEEKKVVFVETWDLTEGGLVLSKEGGGIGYVQETNTSMRTVNLRAYENLKVFINGVYSSYSDIKADSVFDYYVDEEEKNAVVVGEQNYLFTSDIDVNNINLLLVDKVEDGLEVNVKTRYSAKEAKAKLYNLADDIIRVVFDEPQRAVTPGQSAVFYLDDIVLGGGKIM